MIPAVHPRGNNVAGLLRYLFGAGKREEHTDAHLVAAWLYAPPLADLEPPTAGNGAGNGVGDGRRDVRRLVELLEQPVAVGRNPPAKTVWHCSLRNHPTDRTLTDGQWAHISGEVMAAVGLAPHGDTRAVRWVAVRHAPDHIHLVATLVRQDRRTAWAWKDKHHAHLACRDLEERYGLYRVAPPGAGSQRWPHPQELNKAARLAATTGRANAASTRGGRAGRPVAPRAELRRRVREVAAVATDEREFFARLTQAGVLVRLRYSTRAPGAVTGYAVGMPGHVTAAGAIVWYGGGLLGPDLTLPRLRSRWTGTPQAGPRARHAARLAALGNVPPDVSRRAAEIVRDAHEAMRAATGPGGSPAVASAIAYAAADLLTATAHAWEGPAGGPLTEAAEWFDRAAYELPARVPAQRVSQAGTLRAMARLIRVMGALSLDRDTMAALHLIYTLAALAETLADLREAQDRLHQAQAAHHAAGQLRAYHPPAGTTGTGTVRTPMARPPMLDPLLSPVRPGRHR